MLSTSTFNLNNAFPDRDKLFCFVKKIYQISSLEILNYRTENTVMATLTPSFCNQKAMKKMRIGPNGSVETPRSQYD
jgi:hypothetical protein